MAHNMNTFAWEWTRDGMLCYDDVNLLVCGTEIMSGNPYTTNYIDWHVADTCDRKSILLCCIRVVVGVEQAFYEHDIQLNLVLRVGKNGWYGWSRHLRCQLVHPAQSSSLHPREVLDAVGKYLSNTSVTFDFWRAWWTYNKKASTYTWSLSDGEDPEGRRNTKIRVSVMGQLPSDITTWSFSFKVDFDFVIFISPPGLNIDGAYAANSYAYIYCQSWSPVNLKVAQWHVDQSVPDHRHVSCRIARVSSSHPWWQLVCWEDHRNILAKKPWSCSSLSKTDGIIRILVRVSDLSSNDIHQCTIRVFVII